jgi:hypothetical protein
VIDISITILGFTVKNFLNDKEVSAIETTFGEDGIWEAYDDGFLS